MATTTSTKRRRDAARPGEYVELPVEEVVEDPANENVHPELQLVMLTASVRLFGQQRSIVVDRRKVCKAGNGVLRAVKRAGLPTVRCRYTDLTGALADGYRMADNLVTRLRRMDDAITAANLQLIVGSRPDVLPEALGLDAESFARALDPKHWGGRVIDLDGIGHYSIDDETFVIKVGGVRPEDAEGLLARVAAELEGTGYAATLR